MSRVANMFNNTEIKSIKAVRQIEELQHVPFYYPADEELRIELVYEAGRRILPWDVKSDTTLLNSLPIVLVSGKPCNGGSSCCDAGESESTFNRCLRQ